MTFCSNWFSPLVRELALSWLSIRRNMIVVDWRCDGLRIRRYHDPAISHLHRAVPFVFDLLRLQGPKKFPLFRVVRVVHGWMA
jgi:hypothetical protein